MLPDTVRFLFADISIMWLSNVNQASKSFLSWKKLISNAPPVLDVNCKLYFVDPTIWLLSETIAPFANGSSLNWYHITGVKILSLLFVSIRIADVLETIKFDKLVSRVAI